MFWTIVAALLFIYFLPFLVMLAAAALSGIIVAVAELPKLISGAFRNIRADFSKLLLRDKIQYALPLMFAVAYIFMLIF